MKFLMEKPLRKSLLIACVSACCFAALITVVCSPMAFHDGWYLHRDIVPRRWRIPQLSDGKGNFLYFDKNTNSGVLVSVGKRNRSPEIEYGTRSAVFFKNSKNPISVTPKVNSVCLIDRLQSPNSIRYVKLGAANWTELRDFVRSKGRSFELRSVLDEFIAAKVSENRTLYHSRVKPTPAQVYLEKAG